MLGITSYYLKASSLWTKGCNEDSAPYTECVCPLYEWDTVMDAFGMLSILLKDHTWHSCAHVSGISDVCVYTWVCVCVYLFAHHQTTPAFIKYVCVTLCWLHCGPSPQVFLREGERQQLQALLHSEVLRLIVMLQRRFRAQLERKQFVRMREAAICIQVQCWSSSLMLLHFNILPLYFVFLFDSVRCYFCWQ